MTDPAGLTQPLFERLHAKRHAKISPVEQVVWLGTCIDGEVRNRGWLQAYWNLDRRGVSLAEMGETLATLGADKEHDQCNRLAKRLAARPKLKAALDSGGPFGAPGPLAKLSNSLDMVFYKTVPSLTVRIQEYVVANRADLPLSNLAADPFNGRSALHVAADAGNLAWVRRCLAAGATVDAMDDDKQTPLVLAMGLSPAEDTTQIIGALIDAGANLDATDRFGKSLPEIASMRRDVVLQLLNAGFAAAATGRRGNGLLHDVRDTATAKALIKAGASPTLANSRGVTPLHRAARRRASTSTSAETSKATSVLRTLVAAGAINTVDHDGSDCFWRVGASGSSLRALRELGLSVVVEADEHGNHGRTALHRCAWDGRPELARDLVDAGAPLDATTRVADEERGIPAGATALDIAVAGKNRWMVAMLKKLAKAA